jgi:hypothetical protein
MSAGMNLEEAKVIANKMRFTDAVCNALSAKCVPFRKATKLKLKELLDIAKDVDEAKSKGCDEVELSLYYNGWNDGYKKAIDNFAEKLLENAPKNYAGTLELGGASCYLSANQVKKIADQLKG